MDKINKIRSYFTGSTLQAITPATDPPIFNKFSEVTEEVLKRIKDGPTKSCLLDPIPTFLLKECLGVLLLSITRLVNLSLMEGLFPDSFKKVVVTPLMKKSTLPSEDLKNYHPVSGLCFISKLVERVVAKQMKDHIGNNYLDNHYQSVYKAGHSWELALLFFESKVHLALTKGMPVALVLLDLLAAFDTINDDTPTVLPHGSVSAKQHSPHS